MLDFDTAQQLLAEYGSTLAGTEKIGIYDLNNRILATDVYASIDLPPADNSAMDGYAVRAADLTSTDRLPVQEQVFAGQQAAPLQAHYAMRIFTGGLVPAGADTVVMQENCTADGDLVVFQHAVTAGQNIRYRGEDMASGKLILQRGTRLGPGHIAVLAAQGLAEITVYKKLKIGILSTGDELIEPGGVLQPASIYNSNLVTIASLCQRFGTALPVCKHVSDDLEQTKQALADLSNDCDVLFTIGGVSVGAKDYIKPALESLGAELDFWKVQMKPGKPVALAQLDQKIVLCLPGNPVSSFVVFVLLASPLLRHLNGEQQTLRPVQKGLFRLDRTIENGKRTDFVRVRVNHQASGLPILEPYYLQSSGATSSLAWADGLARIPAGAVLHDGCELDWYDLQHWSV